MLKRIKYLLFLRFKHNTFIYIVSILLFMLGICVGALWIGSMSFEAKEVLKENLSDYFLLMPNYNFENAYIFKRTIISNTVPILIIFIVSIKYIGAILAPIYIMFRGFCLGFSIAFLTESFGRKGFIYSLIVMLPQNLIYIPALVFACYTSFNLSIFMFRHRNERFNENKNKYILKHLISGAIILVVLFIAAFIEAYITPVFVKNIVPYL